MNQISTRYVTEGEACYEQYVIFGPGRQDRTGHHP